MKKRIMHWITIVAMVISGLFVVTPAANATIAYPLSIIYADSGYRAAHYLTWIDPNNCYHYPSSSYNWTASNDAGTPGNGAIGQEHFSIAWGQAMSSFYNLAHHCNRVWLMAGPWAGPWGGDGAYNGQLYTQCLKYGQGIGYFGFPWNDNIRQVGLSYDAGCGTAP